MEIVTKLITKSPVFVFSKSYCPYCLRAKQALRSIGVEYDAMELNKVSNGSVIQDALLQMTGRSTVPNVFVNGKSIGGSEECVAKVNDGEIFNLIRGKD